MLKVLTIAVLNKFNIFPNILADMTPYEKGAITDVNWGKTDATNRTSVMSNPAYFGWMFTVTPNKQSGSIANKITSRSMATQIHPDSDCQNHENAAVATTVKGGESCLSSFTNLSPTDLLGAAISLSGSLVATGWLREDRSPFWFYFWMNIWPLVTATAKSISICTPVTWDDMVVNVTVEILNTVVFLYYVSAPVYDDAGSIITFRYGNMEAYKMGTLIAFGGTNILIAVYDYLRSEQPPDEIAVGLNMCKGCVEFNGAFNTFIMGLSMLLLQVLTPSHPIRGDAFNVLLTIQLWAGALAAKDMAANPVASFSSNISGAFRLEKLLKFLLQVIGTLYPFVMLCLGLQGTRELVYVIPPCQWPENVDMSVAAKLTRPMPGIMHDPLPPRSDCTMKNSFGWDLVANASNLTPWGDYSADKNSTKEYGIGPYDPFGTAWGVSSYDFISREKFNESYDAWVAAGLYFNNQTDSGTHSYDHIYSALYISSTTISWLILLCSLCGSKKETSEVF